MLAPSPYHIAVLNCDRIVPASRAAYGQLYSERFAAVLTAAADRLGMHGRVRFSAYDVPEGEYPVPSAIDGIIMPGAIAATYDSDPWIAVLRTYLQRVYRDYPKVRMFGACFGHQLICEALLGPHGARVIPNPQGYEIGVESIKVNPAVVRHAPWLELGGRGDSGELELRMQLCHGDVVAPLSVPDGWICIGSTPKCAVQGLLEPSRVLTFQFHFEFDSHMMADFLKHFFAQDSRFSDKALRQAFERIRADDDADLVAEWVVRFFLDV